MVTIDKRIDGRNLNAGFWICELRLPLDDSMGNAHVIKALTALLDKLSSVGEED